MVRRAWSLSRVLWGASHLEPASHRCYLADKLQTPWQAWQAPSLLALPVPVALLCSCGDLVVLGAGFLLLLDAACKPGTLPSMPWSSVIDAGKPRHTSDRRRAGHRTGFIPGAALSLLTTSRICGAHRNAACTILTKSTASRGCNIGVSRNYRRSHVASRGSDGHVTVTERR